MQPDPNCPKCQGDGVIPSANWDGLPRVECECVREKAEQAVRLQNYRDWRAKLDHVKAERDALRILMGRLIRDACPCNWSDDEESALAWLEAERLSGEPLPDDDYNGPRRAALSRARETGGDS